MVIDPQNITDFNASNEKLEALIFFWILSAGKNGNTAAKQLDLLLSDSILSSPFDIFKPLNINEISTQLKYCGIGCYNNKARSFYEIVHSGLNLRICSVQDLEKIYGIGAKSSRCFIMHTRPNQRLAGLDRHCLSWLSDQGYKVPRSTPTGKKYLKLEQIYLNLCDKLNKSPAELDLLIWRYYSNK